MEPDEVPVYIHLPAGSPLPALSPAPCRIVVLAEQSVASGWQDAVAEWIVNQRCLYVMAWGRDCATWECAVDLTLLRSWDSREIPDESFIMTTSHRDEPLNEVFFYCRFSASHPIIELPRVVIVDVTAHARRDEILEQYRLCRDNLGSDDQDDLDGISTKSVMSRLTAAFNRLIKPT